MKFFAAHPPADSHMTEMAQFAATLNDFLQREGFILDEGAKVSFGEAVHWGLSMEYPYVGCTVQSVCSAAQYSAVQCVCLGVGAGAGAGV